MLTGDAISPFYHEHTSSDSSHDSWDFTILVPNNTKKSRLIEFSLKNVFTESDSNFFVFQNYEVRFSGFFYLILKRSFPRSFEFWDGLELSILKNSKNKHKQRKIQKPGIPLPMGTRPGSIKWQNTPEINELEFSKTFLKIWASNFEKQRS